MVPAYVSRRDSEGHGRNRARRRYADASSGRTIATLAAVRADAYSPPHAIRPLYVRRTDAELARDARAAG